MKIEELIALQINVAKRTAYSTLAHFFPFSITFLSSPLQHSSPPPPSTPFSPLSAFFHFLSSSLPYLHSFFITLVFFLPFLFPPIHLSPPFNCNHQPQHHSTLLRLNNFSAPPLFANVCQSEEALSRTSLHSRVCSILWWMVRTMKHPHYPHSSPLPPFISIHRPSPPFTPIPPHSPPFISIHRPSPPFTPIHHHSPPFTTIHPHSPPFTTIHHHSPPFITIHFHSPPFTPFHHHPPFNSSIILEGLRAKRQRQLFLRR